MAHTKNCKTCGKEFVGNINRQFCTDSCRKYFSRHGAIGHSGIDHNLPAQTDNSGQRRTSAGSGLSNYAGKKLIDVVGKMAEQRLMATISASQTGASASLSAKMPLVTASPAHATEATNQPRRYRPALSAALQSFLGDLTYPFQMLVWGLPGSGKSTLSMMLADALADRFKVLYVSGEESLTSATLQQKQERTLTRPSAQFLFANRLPVSAQEWRQVLYASPATPITNRAPTTRAQQPGAVAIRPGGDYLAYRTVVYDSITMLDIHPFYAKATANDCQLPAFSQHISHVFISHAHKDGKEYRGDGSWGHEVDVIIRCHEGLATIQKNRFATAEHGRIGSSLRIY